VHPGVVANVDDRGQFVIAGRPGGIPGKLAKAEVLLYAEQESGPADSTDQNGDSHIVRH